MQFENYTTFPAMSWITWDNKGNEYVSIVGRIKYLLDTMDSDGRWSLVLDSDQGDLFDADIFYDDDMDASVRFESDLVAYKPHADLIVNCHAHASIDRAFWECDVKAIRYTDGRAESQTLLSKHLKVYGERAWKDNLMGWGIGVAKPTNKVPIRYENAFGGTIPNPEYKDDTQDEYLEYYESNPVGKGLIHASLLEHGNIPMPQIESINDPVTDSQEKYTPQGLGFIPRTWIPRLSLAGTFDDEWLENKHPVMPDDYKERYNNAAHPDLQLRSGYFEGGDIIMLKSLLIGAETQSLVIPDIELISMYHIGGKEMPFDLKIDTIVVDILHDDIKQNAVYVSYRARTRYTNKLDKVSLQMRLPDSMLATTTQQGAQPWPSN